MPFIKIIGIAMLLITIGLAYALYETKKQLKIQKEYHEFYKTTAGIINTGNIAEIAILENTLTREREVYSSLQKKQAALKIIRKDTIKKIQAGSNADETKWGNVYLPSYAVRMLESASATTNQNKNSGIAVASSLN